MTKYKAAYMAEVLAGLAREFGDEGKTESAKTMHDAAETIIKEVVGDNPDAWVEAYLARVFRILGENVS